MVDGGGGKHTAPDSGLQAPAASLPHLSGSRGFPAVKRTSSAASITEESPGRGGGPGGSWLPWSEL